MSQRERHTLSLRHKVRQAASLGKKRGSMSRHRVRCRCPDKGKQISGDIVTIAPASLSAPERIGSDLGGVVGVNEVTGGLGCAALHALGDAVAGDMWTHRTSFPDCAQAHPKSLGRGKARREGEGLCAGDGGDCGVDGEERGEGAQFAKGSQAAGQGAMDDGYE
jgi:hypothetical protein